MTALTPSKTLCHHCGTQIVSGNITHDGQEFCCQGCSTAYDIIKDTGLLHYYANRDDFGSRPTPDADLEIYDRWETELSERQSIRQGTFVVQGMHCASCVWLNERVLNSIPGVISAEANLMGRRLSLSYDQRITNLRRIARTLQEIGYTITPVGSGTRSPVSNDLLKRMGVAGFCAGNLMLIAVALYSGYFGYMDRSSRNLFHVASLLLVLPVVFYSAAGFFKNAWASIRHRIFSMDLLTSAGISLAFLFSSYNALWERGEVFFDSIGFVTFILLTGRFIENRLLEKNQTAVENLSLAIPDVARRLTNDEETIIPSSQVLVGDRLRVLAGESVPADGILREPLCEFDESLLTGEFAPVSRSLGAMVFGGAKALQDTTLEVTATPINSVIGHIRKAASNPEPPSILRLTQRAARVFLVFAFLAAGITFVWWWMLGDPAQAVISTVALLIAACPCALSLAVPTAYNAGLELALRAGIILKHGRVLEDMANVRVLAMDKTGTLTAAKPTITETHTYGMTADAAILIADALETQADAPHPLRFAFAEARDEIIEARPGALKEKTIVGISLTKEQTEYRIGRGIVAKTASETWLLGSVALLREFAVPVALEEETGQSHVYLARVDSEPVCLASFAIQDTLRPEAAETVAKLKRFVSVEMLTGDSGPMARTIARSVGIDRVHAGVSPFEKEAIIRGLSSSGVCMVGDGINDAAALASANVGIAFATTAQIPLTGAHCVIPGQRLATLLYLFQISKQTRRKIVQNLVISFVYNLLLIPMAMKGWIIPLTGALFMSASSLTVLLNSLSLLRQKPDGETHD